MIHQLHNSRGYYNYNAYVYTSVFWDFHFHENYELVYTLEGKVELTVGSSRVVLYEGELLLIPPNTVHSLSISNASIWVGVFSEDHVSGFAKENSYARYSKFRLSEENDAFLRKNLFFRGEPEKCMRCACLYLVCSECLKSATLESTQRDKGFISETTKYISENLKGELTLRDVCDSLGYEYHYYSTLFNDIFGMGFKSFINTCRVNRACTMLRDRGLSITDICAECGFGSIRNFNRAFKKISGITPSEYRLQNIK